MKATIFHFGAPLGTSSRVDRQAGIIRGVAVITGGVTAKGHDLEVDETTLRQIAQAGREKGRVQVKLNHRDPQALQSICGYLSGFRIEGNKVLADWHLLKSHEEFSKIVEKAEVMPDCFGLSAAFAGPKEGEKVGGKRYARCEELLAVDCVPMPAANPDGLFEARMNARQFVGNIGDTRLIRAREFIRRRLCGLLGKVSAKKAHEFNTGGRDRMGRFLPSEGSGGVDPNSMAAAYGGVSRERNERLRSIQPNSKLGQKIATAEVEAKGLNPYAGATISGAASGAILGAAPLLRRGWTPAGLAKSMIGSAALSGSIVGGGAYIGSKIIGDPEPEEGSAFTKRAAIGGTLVGAGAGLAGGLLVKSRALRAILAKGARRNGGIAKKAHGAVRGVQNAVRAGAREWTPAAALQKSGIVGAAGVGAGAGGAYGLYQGADEGQQVDSIINMRKDIARAREEEEAKKRLARSGKVSLSRKIELLTGCRKVRRKSARLELGEKRGNEVPISLTLAMKHFKI